MKSIKHTASFLILPIILMSFSRCSSQKKLQETAPMQLGQAYCQTWIAGVQGGGSGLNIFIPANLIAEDNIVMDSVYFRGKVAKLQTKPQNKSLYIGRFETDINKKKDMVMSNDGKAEYGNEMPKIPETIPFELKANECVISYTDGGKTKYFKISNVVEKIQQAFPSRPLEKQ